MTINEIKKDLDEAGCSYEIIEQDKPILSVSDAESFYPVEKSAPTFVLQTGYLAGCIPLVGLEIPCIFDKNYFAMILFLVEQVMNFLH